MHSTHAHIHTHPLFSSLGWWRTFLLCKHGQPLSFTDPPVPSALRDCQVTFRMSMSRVPGDHKPSLSRMLQYWKGKERFYTACLHRNGECTGEKSNLPENTLVTAQKRIGTENLYFAFNVPGWLLEDPCSTLWWPELSRTASSYWGGVGLCRAFAITGINPSKLLTVPRGSLRSWKSDGGENERNALRGSRGWWRLPSLHSHLVLGLALNAEAVD